MAQFSKDLNTGKGKFEFGFTRIIKFGKIRFFVTVLDTSGRLLCFNMMKSKDDVWRIMEVDRLPSWIINMEQALSSCIFNSQSKLLGSLTVSQKQRKEQYNKKNSDSMNRKRKSKVVVGSN